MSFNREGWLTEVARTMEPIFTAKGFKIKKQYKLTCGWPVRFALSPKAQRVGECHNFASSAAGVYELFISPVLAKPKDVIGTVCHELIHVSVGTEEGHTGRFAKACRYLGMTGKPTCAMPGPKLAEELLKLAEPFGEYPHSVLKPVCKPAKPSKGYIKLECVCGCVVRITEKHLTDFGSPVCGCGNLFTADEGDE